MRRSSRFQACRAFRSVVIFAVTAALVVPLRTLSAQAAPRQPLPAGPAPSELATMPCQPKAAGELADALGLRGTVTDKRWVHHRYSCAYRYSTGSFTVSIQELSSWPQTFAYYRSLGRAMGDARSLANLGQGAYQTTHGSVVVRKDWKVLLVDIAGLPPRFGVPPTSASDIAVTVADVILGCWAGD